MESQGLTRPHEVAQGLKRSHKAPQGLTRSHKASLGLTRPHRVSRGDSQVCSFSVWPLLGTLYHTYVAKTLHTAGNSIESQHGLLVIQWSPSMACWSSADADRIHIVFICLSSLNLHFHRIESHCSKKPEMMTLRRQ